MQIIYQDNLINTRISEDIVLIKGECLEVMSELIDRGIKVDSVICDLPFGTTQNKWDSVIPLDRIWDRYNSLIKDRGAIALFAQSPFDKVLGCSNLKMLKYEWIWKKGSGTGHLNAKCAPMKEHENILIFSKSAASPVKDNNKIMIYNPQFREGKPYTCKSGRNSTNYGSHNSVITVSNGNYYPLSVIEFKKERGLHPTQKPVPLLEYLIKTYTNKGDLILDNTAGSFSTAIAAINTGRRFIGIELDDKYFEIGCNRVAEHLKNKQ